MAEEAIRSDFQTLRDSSATLLAMRQSFTSDVGLTTTIAAVEDKMEALGNASDALRKGLLDAGFAPIDLRNGSVSSGDVKLNLSEFLAWTTGAPGQAFAAIRSGASSGLELSVKPALAELKAFLDKGILSLPSTGCEQHFESKPIETAFCLIKEHVNAASDAIAALPRPRMCPPPSAPYQPKVTIRPPSKTKSEA
jgi:hypothetical protein